MILARGRQEGFTTKDTKGTKKSSWRGAPQNNFVSFVSFVVQAFFFPPRTASAQ